MVILKIIAWAERHRIVPAKDAYDLRLLFSHYLDAGHLQHLYDDHVDLITEDFDYALAGGRVAGRDVAALLDRHDDRSQNIRKQLRNILAPEVDPEGRRVLIGQSGARDVERFRMQLESFLQGLSES